MLVWYRSVGKVARKASMAHEQPLLRLPPRNCQAGAGNYNVQAKKQQSCSKKLL